MPGLPCSRTGFRSWIGVRSSSSARVLRAALGLFWLAWAAGCTKPGEDLPSPGDSPLSRDASTNLGLSATVDKQAILDGSIESLRGATLKPGSTSFSSVSANMNQYFLDTGDDEFKMSESAREYLRGEFPAERIDEALRDLEARAFTTRDARHIEDCLLYQGVAGRVAGEGEQLERVGRLFDWVCRQVALVAPGSLAPPGTTLHPPVRPYDVLLRGLAVEADDWAERSWLFMTLCRQINVDVGLIAYAPADSKKRRYWICAAIVDDKPYLFDARIGRPVPTRDGRGIATLQDAATDPAILEALDMPGLFPYDVRATDLLPGRVSILIDSTLGYMTPRMRLLQRDLAGKHKMILFRDPGEEAAAFRKALGIYADKVRFWSLPLTVDARLRSDSAFVRATQYSLQFFDPRAELPLIRARLKQLRGDLTGAVEDYALLRFVERPRRTDVKRTPIPADVQHSLDVYATHFLALCQLDRNQLDQAELLFEQSLRLAAGESADDSVGFAGAYVPRFHSSTQTNLGLLAAKRRSIGRSLRFLLADDPTWQRLGNLLTARDLIFEHPFGPAADPPTPFAPMPILKKEAAVEK